MCMRAVDDYIPVELWYESKNFIQVITDDVEIYKKIRSFDSVKKSDEADRFVAWWDLKRFTEVPHALILIYENLERINETVGNYDVLDGLNKLKMKMVLFYRLLKKQEMIDE